VTQNQWNAWTPEEDDRLRAMFAAGLCCTDFSEIEKNHGRPKSSSGYVENIG
jgi:hypothetical protein